MANSVVESEFNKAAQKIKTWDPHTLPTEDDKLTLYSLFKQATEGDCSGKRPGILNYVARRKWDAWNARKGLGKEEAMKQYIDTVTNFMATFGNRASD